MWTPKTSLKEQMNKVIEQNWSIQKMKACVKYMDNDGGESDDDDDDSNEVNIHRNDKPL